MMTTLLQVLTKNRAWNQSKKCSQTTWQTLVIVCSTQTHLNTLAKGSTRVRVVHWAKISEQLSNSRTCTRLSNNCCTHPSPCLKSDKVVRMPLCCGKRSVGVTSVEAKWPAAMTSLAWPTFKGRPWACTQTAQRSRCLGHRGTFEEATRRRLRRRRVWWSKAAITTSIIRLSYRTRNPL